MNGATNTQQAAGHQRASNSRAVAAALPSSPVFAASKGSDGVSDQHEKARRIVEQALDDQKEENEAEVDQKIDEASGIGPEAAEIVMDVEDDIRDRGA